MRRINFFQVSQHKLTVDKMNYNYADEIYTYLGIWVLWDLTKTKNGNKHQVYDSAMKKTLFLSKDVRVTVCIFWTIYKFFTKKQKKLLPLAKICLICAYYVTPTHMHSFNLHVFYVPSIFCIERGKWIFDSSFIGWMVLCRYKSHSFYTFIQ